MRNIKWVSCCITVVYQMKSFARRVGIMKRHILPFSISRHSLDHAWEKSRLYTTMAFESIWVSYEALPRPLSAIQDPKFNHAFKDFMPDPGLK